MRSTGPAISRALQLNPQGLPLSQALVENHFLRKHGSNAYYGQQDKERSS
jgi:L-ribulose-5-phosphate 4-epimerase